jgi:hypothetical protein
MVARYFHNGLLTIGAAVQECGIRKVNSDILVALVGGYDLAGIVEYGNGPNFIRIIGNQILICGFDGVCAAPAQAAGHAHAQLGGNHLPKFGRHLREVLPLFVGFEIDQRCDADQNRQGKSQGDFPADCRPQSFGRGARVSRFVEHDRPLYVSTMAGPVECRHTIYGLIL